MSLKPSIAPERRKKLAYGIGACALVFLIALGIFASNGWLPKTDPMTGKKTGWFGSPGSPPYEGGVDASRDRGGSLSEPPAPLPNATPSLSKEYIYAGSRLLAVEDANAGATPTPTPAGFEGDVAERFTGDGVLLSNDVTVERQFVVGLATPEPGTNEFQRADAAPFSTLGDCAILSNDLVQVRNYVSGLAPMTTAGGPTAPCGSGPQGAGKSEPDLNSPNTPGNREIRVNPANGRRGETITVPVFLKADGDELAVSFTLEYDTVKLSNPRVNLAENLPASTVLTINTTQPGKIGILVDAEEVFASNPRQLRIVFITFDIRLNAPNGPAPLNLTDSLAKKGVSDRLARLLVTNYANGSIGVMP